MFGSIKPSKNFFLKVLSEGFGEGLKIRDNLIIVFVFHSEIFIFLFVWSMEYLRQITQAFRSTIQVMGKEWKQGVSKRGSLASANESICKHLI